MSAVGYNPITTKKIIQEVGPGENCTLHTPFKIGNMDYRIQQLDLKKNGSTETTYYMWDWTNHRCINALPLNENQVRIQISSLWSREKSRLDTSVKSKL